jgi:hypothetical protein
MGLPVAGLIEISRWWIASQQSWAWKLPHFFSGQQNRAAPWGNPLAAPRGLGDGARPGCGLTGSAILPQDLCTPTGTRRGFLALARLRLGDADHRPDEWRVPDPTRVPTWLPWPGQRNGLNGLVPTYRLPPGILPSGPANGFASVAWARSPQDQLLHTNYLQNLSVFCSNLPRMPLIEEREVTHFAERAFIYAVTSCRETDCSGRHARPQTAPRPGRWQ